MRELHKITLSNLEGEPLMKAIDIISAALVAQFHKRVMVLREGCYTQDIIDALPPNVSVFLVCVEGKSNHKEIAAQSAEMMVGEDLKAFRVMPNGEAESGRVLYAADMVSEIVPAAMITDVLNRTPFPEKTEND